MLRKLFAIASFCFLYGSFLFLHIIFDERASENSPVIRNKTINFGFADYNKAYPPPDWWRDLNSTDPHKYPIFKLSQDYPLEKPSPECPPEECRWKKFKFETQSREYLLEVLKYSFAGNLENHWRLQENRMRRWYHAPWMDATDFGREFIHGLTKERHLCKEELLGETKIPCTSDKRDIENWAVGFYNERGAYYIGKVWREVLRSKPDAAKFPAEGFPDGSVSMKLLFTQAHKDLHEAPFLENSFEFQVANQRETGKIDMSVENCLTPREINRECIDVMRLLQIDIAVRDDRAPNGWVFGTFIYNFFVPPIFDDYEFASETTEAEKENLRRWLKLEIVGLAYGNDENVELGGEIKESIINRQIGVKQKLGCGDRLNGVVDNPVSSCVSCHAFAETAKNLEPVPMPYNLVKEGCKPENIVTMFRNINPRDQDLTARTFTRSTPNRKIVSLDYSLQLREGITRYCEENRKKCGWTKTKDQSLLGITRSGLEILFDRLRKNEGK